METIEMVTTLEVREGFTIQMGMFFIFQVL
jgi:hypothetical protein